MSRLSIAEAEQLVAEALMCVGAEAANARSVAKALVAAEAAGQSGHGLRRVVAYAAQARTGKVNGAAKPLAERPRPGILAIDAANGFAYPALDLAVAELPEIAREQGVALAAIHRSHHAGVMALTVERLAEKGLVAMMVANTPAGMAPWGGKTALYGTNPIAFAAPLPADDPIVVDLSLSKVARGKVMAAKQKGEAIPEDWAFDSDGRPTTDPSAALSGTMAPAGEAKGAALALMVEILAAGVTGANYSYEASSLFDGEGPPPGLGQMIIAMDPAAIGGEGVLARFRELAARIGEEPGVRLPGRRGQSSRRKAIEKGLAVDDDVIESIQAIR